MTPARESLERESLEAEGFQVISAGEVEWRVEAKPEMFGRLRGGLGDSGVVFSVTVRAGYPRNAPAVAVVSPRLRSAALAAAPLQHIYEPNAPSWPPDAMRISTVLKDKIYFLSGLTDLRVSEGAGCASG